MAEFAERPIYTELARIGKATASPVRLRLLDLLDGRERTVEDLAREADVALKNTSAQLQVLREAQLVRSRREGSHVYYRLADPEVSRWLAHLEEFAEHRLAELRQAIAEHLGDPEEMEPVSAAELARRAEDPNLVVVDVRSHPEYLAGHVPGAISLPRADLRRRLGALPREAEIVAYCQGPYCVVSPEAVRLLRRHGFRARPLEGGFTRWRRGRHRIERDSSGQD